LVRVLERPAAQQRAAWPEVRRLPARPGTPVSSRLAASGLDP
jgi:hypothetical protein